MSTSQPSSDPADQSLKKWEELYALTKDYLTKTEERFDSVEEKSSRHFAFLGVLLGAVGIGLPELTKIMAAPCSYLGNSFITSYALLALALLAAMVMYLGSLNYSVLKDLPMNQKLLDHFKKNRYVDVLYSMSCGNLDAIQENYACLKNKLWYSKRAYSLTKLVLCLAVIVGILYITFRVLHPEIWLS